MTIYSRIGAATPGGPPTRSRPSSKMTKYVECWGADKPFANITDSKMAKNIGLAVRRTKSRLETVVTMSQFSFVTRQQSIAMIESNLLPTERRCSDFNCFGPPTELRPVTMWYRNSDRESMYRKQPDPHFRFDLICSFIIFLSLGLLQLIVIRRWVDCISGPKNVARERRPFRFVSATSLCWDRLAPRW